ncbi:hypothetical protein [Virgibacillus necropolis]|uniref:Uncharacterized protein n=1 Tax=Virgibacillus necropolis TaxID=163877 RepID=A0A221MGQ2_9BACI|nr:hypothetical protein [Virgibacillus necropolis]ASN06814.1 hypothetical protein CFK40_18200 [Virgibacillus necropolis]
MTRKNNSTNDEEGISELSKRLNENCTSYPVAVLKNSINVYYPNINSAIYLPGENPAVERLIDIFEETGLLLLG